MKLPLPQHIAIIMDGNGRWAQSKKLPRIVGHRVGAETLKTIVEACLDLKLSYLTVYAFSTENWKRPAQEVEALMDLLVEYIDQELVGLQENGVRIKTIGDLAQLPEKAEQKVKKAEAKTKNNQKLYLQIALNYGGRKEIITAINQITQDVVQGKIAAGSLNEALFEQYLYTVGIPEPDLLIRTAGELRLSNFLLWQTAYTEFWFSDLFWPAFTAEHLWRAIRDYQARQRRFGGLQGK